MVYTDDPSRQGVLDAIRKRHTYGATDNIILDVRMGKYFMGDEFSLNKAEPIRVKVTRHRQSRKGRDHQGQQSYLRHGTEEAGCILRVHRSRRREWPPLLLRSRTAGRRMIAWSSPFFINYSERAPVSQATMRFDRS